MSGVLGTLTDDQQQVCMLMPYPLASVWREVLSASSPAQVQTALHLQIEVTARLLAILLFCDYLRGPVAEPVEALVGHFDRAEAEHWLALLAACLDALAARQEPPMLMQQALEWRRRKATAEKTGLALLEQLVHQRRAGLNDVRAISSLEAAQHAEELLHATADLLASLRWLGAWRLLRVVDLTTLRHRGFAGHVQLFQGAADTPEPQPAAWTAHLVVDALYLVDPSGCQLLEVSPLLRVLPHPRTRKPLCFLFDASPRHHSLVLAHHASGVRVETSIAGPDGAMALAEWLARRAEHGSWLTNVDLDQTLSVDPQGLAFGSPERTAPPRPISGLSHAAFLPQSHAAAGSGWRSRAALGLQLAVVLVLTLVTLASVAPRFRKVSADISDEAARPRRVQAQLEGLGKAPAVAAAPAVPPSPGPAAGAVAETGAATAAVASAVPAAAQPPAAAEETAKVQAAQAEIAKADAAKAEAAKAEAAKAEAAKAEAAKAQAAQVAAAKAEVTKIELAKAEAAKAQAAQVAAAKAARSPPAPASAATAGTAGDVERALKMLDVRPSYALLKLTIAKRRGHAGADAALAQVYWRLKQVDRCRHHALLALKAAPQDAAVIELGSRCKAQPGQAAAEPDPPIDGKDLANRLYAEAYSIIYGASLTPPLRRQLAKDLYQEAAQLGLGRAHTGLAAIYLFGESNHAKCLQHAQAAIQLGEKGQAVKLRDQCLR